jgi:regulator of RNase E activity RraA
MIHACIETAKATAGPVNLPAVCAGAVVNPGEVEAAGQDGLVVVSCLRAEEVVKPGERRRSKERRSLARLRAGETHPMAKAGAQPLRALMSIVVVQAEMRRMRREAKQ